MISQKQPALPVHEWLAIISILTILAIFTCCALLGPINISSVEDKPHHLVEMQIEVTIEGAVEKPGTYQLERHATLKDLLTLAIPKKEAQLGRLKLTRKLSDGQIVRIQAKGKKKQLSSPPPDFQPQSSMKILADKSL